MPLVTRGRYLLEHSHMTNGDRSSIPRRGKQADLQFVFERSADGLSLAVTYDTEVFSPARAQTILLRLRAVLNSMTAERPLTEILTQENFPSA